MSGSASSPGEVSDGAARFIRKVVGPWVRLCFRPRLLGAENLPDPPYLLVSNHSAGLGIAELASFAWAFQDTVGPRQLAGFAHPIGFKVWPITAIHRHLGSIPSTYDAAYDTLDAGVPILVFPGGDYETLRPIWKANRVDFGGRVGFLRIAKTAGVPVVPMGIRGSHYTAPMLVRARFLAWLFVLPRALGQKRWGVSLLGAIIAVASFAAWSSGLLPLWAAAAISFLFVVSPLAFIPWVPWSIRMRIGEPLGADELPDDLDEARSVVEKRIEALVRSRERSDNP